MIKNILKQLSSNEIICKNWSKKKHCEAVILQWNKFVLKNDFKNIVNQLFPNKISLFFKMIFKILWSNYPPMK